MQATFSSQSFRPPIHDQISELQRKIQLLEGDRSAQYESAQSEIHQNRETILQLREQNTNLQRSLAHTLTGNEQVIREVFQSRGSERAAYRNMSGQAALQVLDQKVLDQEKKLNALKHTSRTYKHQLEQLHTHQHNQRESKPRPLSAEHDTNLRVLENRLEKAQLKCQEAEHIMRGYLKVKEHLQEESLTFQSQLDGLENEILHQKQELQQLQLMNTDAHQAKDSAKEELEKQECMVYGERRERELVLNHYKKQAEEHKAQIERGERRIQRGALQQDELSSEVQRSLTAAGEEDRNISSFQEAFQLIKEATGVTHTQEVVDRFRSQKEVQVQLEEMKQENERVLQQLKHQRDAQHTQLHNIKYSGETQLTRGREVLDEFVFQLQKQQQRHDSAKETLERLKHTVSSISTAVQHLSEKLQHIVLQDPPVQQAVSSDHVVDLLYEAEQKLQQLQDELQAGDPLSLIKEMDEQEFQVSIEGKLPDYNTRITLPETQRADVYDDDDSGDDDGEVITRAALKQQSQLIIDSKTKRKIRLRKKKNKL
ncbi:coiled-coil domain-containing protein 151 [Trichomycterus rosablanca]|uniref:coiled-coil domain-containing protein 151 n=1 Tax=Trichomycterus rosablanca TaxID=2290929 RepID=UPI002F35C6FD